MSLALQPEEDLIKHVPVAAAPRAIANGEAAGSQSPICKTRFPLFSRLAAAGGTAMSLALQPEEDLIKHVPVAAAPRAIANGEAAGSQSPICKTRFPLSSRLVIANDKSSSL